MPVRNRARDGCNVFVRCAKHRHVGRNYVDSAPKSVPSVCTGRYTRSPRFSAAVTTLATRLTHVGLSAHYAQRQALARMYAMLLRQAQAISYFEVY